MRITIVISGGNVQAVYAPHGVEIELIDFDNPSRSSLDSEAESCPKNIIDEIEAQIRDAEEHS